MKYSKDQVSAILNELNQKFDASIQAAQANPEKQISTLVLDLSTERQRGSAFKVSFPMTSVFIEDATDLNTFVRLIPNSNDTIQDDIMLKKRDSFSFENGIRESYLYWPAQPGKTIIIKFFVSSEFRNGSLIIDQSNIPVTEEVGFARGDLDGFTRKVYFDKRWNGGTNAFLYDTENDDFNNGSYNGSSGRFKVPEGYFGLVLGIQMNVIQQNISVPAQIRLMAVPEGDAWSNDNPGTDLRLCDLGSTADYPTGEYKVRVISVNEALGAARKAPKILAGECPYLSMDLFATATNGDYRGILLIRLVPIVGGA